jgi:hypothetical protein
VLPLVFVSLGLGSVIVSALEIAPWLIVTGRQRHFIFAATGALLALNYVLAVERPRRATCAPGEICHRDSPAMRVNRLLFWTSAAIFAGAAIFTYGALLWVRMQS